MKISRYRIYMLIHALIAVIVILLFKMIEERKVAALMAGSLFIVGPAYVLWKESKMGFALKRTSWWSSLVFLCISSLPIFLLRVIYWNEAFENIQVMGLSGPRMHSMSSYLFIVMLLGFFMDSFLEKREQMRVRDYETQP